MGNCLHCSKKPCMAKKEKHGSGAKRRTETKVAPVSEDSMIPGCGRLVDRDEENGFIRVKIVLTKMEAARLLSKCAGDEEKMMEYIIGELEKSGRGHRSGVGHESSHGGWSPALESIPEGF